MQDFTMLSKWNNKGCIRFNFFHSALFGFDLQYFIGIFRINVGLGFSAILDSDLLDVVIVFPLISLKYKLNTVGFGGFSCDVDTIEAGPGLGGQLRFWLRTGAVLVISPLAVGCGGSRLHINDLLFG